MDALKEPAEPSVEETAAGETDANPLNSDFQAKTASLKAKSEYVLSTQRTDNDLAAQNLKLKELLQVALKTKQTLEKENEELLPAHPQL